MTKCLNCGKEIIEGKKGSKEYPIEEYPVPDGFCCFNCWDDWGLREQERMFEEGLFSNGSYYEL